MFGGLNNNQQNGFDFNNLLQMFTKNKEQKGPEFNFEDLLKKNLVVIKKKKNIEKKEEKIVKLGKISFKIGENLEVNTEMKKIHFNVSCDGCQQAPLIGERFKCETCENFDFCSKCHKEGKHDKNHKFK